jgi:hypothetical protein
MVMFLSAKPIFSADNWKSMKRGFALSIKNSRELLELLPEGDGLLVAPRATIKRLDGKTLSGNQAAPIESGR